MRVHMKAGVRCLFAAVIALAMLVGAAVPALAASGAGDKGQAGGADAVQVATTSLAANAAGKMVSKDAPGMPVPAAGASIEEAPLWGEGIDCSTCHEAVAGTFDDEGLLVHAHALAGAACVDCHGRAQGIEDVHQGADAQKAAKVKKLKKTDVPVEACLVCHDATALEQAGEATDLLTDTEGTVVNPHALPQVADHAGVTCAKCHAMHTDKTPQKLAPKACKSCHHADVYACGTCHQ